MSTDTAAKSPEVYQATWGKYLHIADGESGRTICGKHIGGSWVFGGYLSNHLHEGVQRSTDVPLCPVCLDPEHTSF